MSHSKPCRHEIQGGLLLLRAFESSGACGRGQREVQMARGHAANLEGRGFQSVFIAAGHCGQSWRGRARALDKPLRPCTALD